MHSAKGQNIRSVPFLILFVAVALMFGALRTNAQTAAFTYQGRLNDGGTPANGSYDLQFSLWDSQDGGTQIGATQTISSVSVSAGIFSVLLDFGSNSFSGATRFLEISARLSGAGPFTLLTPRQQITSTPYAVRSLNTSLADTAINATQLGGVAAANYVQTSDSRLADARPPTAGSFNYIQNMLSQQPGSNFNISGNGTAGGTLSGKVVNATTQYNISGNRAFVINGAGVFPTGNTFVGASAGASTTPGANTVPTGNVNSFFGFAAGQFNTFGEENSFFGAGAGLSNTVGSDNAFFGVDAGSSNTGGADNSFFGSSAGTSNTDESDNTFIGAFSNGVAGIFNATAIGAFARVTQSNSLVLGNGVKVGIGTTAPVSALHLNGNGDNFALTFSNQANTFGKRAYRIAFDNDRLSFQRADDAGNFAADHMAINQATGNVGIGTTNSGHKLEIVDPSNTGLRVQTNTAGGTVASFGGNGSFQIDAPGVSGGRLNILEDGRVGINIPSVGNINNRLDVNGTIAVWTLGSSGSTQLCWNSGTFQISTCSSSRRYKMDLRPFSAGLNVVNRLHPITFQWKTDRMVDVGLVAEDVAAVEPLLVTHNAKGEIEGVKYDRLTVVLINSIKEQQQQIVALRSVNAALNARLRVIERTLRRKPLGRH